MDCQALELLALRYELDFFADSDDPASCLRLDVLLRYVLALVVKEAIRVPGPRDAPHVDLWYGDDSLLKLAFVDGGRASGMLALTTYVRVCFPPAVLLGAAMSRQAAILVRIT